MWGTVAPPPPRQCVYVYLCIYIYIYIHWRRKRGGQGGHVPPHFFDWGGNGMFVPPPLLTPHFYFPLELYVYITLTNNNLAFLIYQLIILWTITIKWHRWLLVNNHISNYNSFILVLYRRYINHVSVCPPTFWHLATPLIYIYIYLKYGLVIYPKYQLCIHYVYVCSIIQPPCWTRSYTVWYLLLITIPQEKKNHTQNVLLFSLHLRRSFSDFLITSIRWSKVKAERFFGGILFHSWFINK